VRKNVWSVAVATFGAWVAYGLAAAVAGRTVNDPQFDVTEYAHPVIGVARQVGTAALIGSWIVVVCAGLPLAAVAMRQALSRRDQTAIALFATAPVGLAVFVAYTALLILVAPPDLSGLADVAVTGSWFALGVLVAAIAVVWPTAALLRRTQYSAWLLRLARSAAMATAALLTVSVVGGAAYGVGIWITTPSIVASDDSVLGAPLPVTWGALLVVAVGAAAIADRAALRARHDASGPSAI